MDTPPPPPPPPSEQLLMKKKIQVLESRHAHLKEEISKFMIGGPKSPDLKRIGYGGEEGNMGSSSFRRESSSRDHPPKFRREIGPMTVNLTNKQYLNILQSMGQAVHIFDSSGRVTYWNRSAEHLYVYSASEALGQYVMDLVIDPRDLDGANEIMDRCFSGENWTGQFPVNSKIGKRFEVIVSITPLYDDLGSLVGIISVHSASDPFLEVQFPSSERDPSEAYPSTNRPRSGSTTKPDLKSLQPLQVVIASKMSNLASKMTNKVRSKIRAGENTLEHGNQGGDDKYSNQSFSEAVLADHGEDATSSGASTPAGDIHSSFFSVPSEAARGGKYPGKPFQDSGDEGEIGIHNFRALRPEAWIGKKVISWPREGSEQVGSVTRTTHGVWPWSNHDQANDFSQQKSSNTNEKPEIQAEENNRFGNEASCSWSSSLNVTSTSSVSSGTSSSIIHKVHKETDSWGYDILWEDLKIGEELGGSCGTVFRGLWCGSDVAVKVFSKLQYSDDLLHSFRQEVSLMKRLRHPNVLLFMGAVTSPQQLCIVTEFLPRGSLFQLLRRTPLLDWRRRVLMALDIARGWGLWFLPTQTSNVSHYYDWERMPQWMAPEVLRNEPSDEKSDVYGYGVILWELATQKIPWDNLNSVQVIGAVGFMNKRIEIPKDMDPRWVSIIESCWHSEPKCRPTFQELLEKLKDLLRQGENVTASALQISLTGSRKQQKF